MKVICIKQDKKHGFYKNDLCEYYFSDKYEMHLVVNRNDTYQAYYTYDFYKHFSDIQEIRKKKITNILNNINE